MASLESESTAPLSFVQLRDAARKIPHEKIIAVARNLGLSQNDMDAVHFSLQQYPTFVSIDENRLKILEAWKHKDPENCTLENLVRALKQLNLNNAAGEVEEAVKGSRREEQQLEQKYREFCQSKLPLTDTMANSMSSVVPTSICADLGFQLGLSRQQMEAVFIKCKPENTPVRNIIFEMLMCWKEMEGGNAVLGKLYKALRMLQCNDKANEVYKIGTETE